MTVLKTLCANVVQSKKRELKCMDITIEKGIKIIIMEKYYEIKEKYPEYLLIFQNGDFWEMYTNDTTIASRVLDIDIKKQTYGHSPALLMIRFPYNELDTHLTKLIRFGSRVALCEQNKPTPPHNSDCNKY